MPKFCFSWFHVPHTHRMLQWEMQLGTRPLSGRGVFVINGVSWIMFDVVVPIGFWLM